MRLIYDDRKKFGMCCDVRNWDGEWECATLVEAYGFGKMLAVMEISEPVVVDMEQCRLYCKDDANTLSAIDLLASVENDAN